MKKFIIPIAVISILIFGGFYISDTRCPSCEKYLAKVKDSRVKIGKWGTSYKYRESYHCRFCGYEWEKIVTSSSCH